jgi:hypothetical protein
MPVNIKVIHTKDFINTTATSIFDFAASKQALLDIASQITKPGEYEIFVDTREADMVLSVVDIFELGQALAAHSSLRRSKIALLTSMSDADQAQFFETVTVNQGVRFRVFTDFEKAITWLVVQAAL